jgi:dolichyl-phosphate-mannose-protein mannosyltransferase
VPPASQPHRVALALLPVSLPSSPHTRRGDTTLSISTRSRVWLIGALTLVFLRALPNLGFPIARDQGTYCFIGEQLLQGKHLYLDLWDNKPPGIFYIYAVIVRLFGTAMWSVAVVDFLWLLVISYCIYKSAERYLGTGAACIAVVFHAAWRAQAGCWDAAQTENFLMLCVFGAYLLAAREARAVAQLITCPRALPGGSQKPRGDTPEFRSSK